MRTLGVAAALLVVVIGAMLALRPATAQEASPGADPCAPLARDEVIALAETYLEAIEAGNAFAIDLILDDDVTHNLDAASTNTSGNDDEILLLLRTTGVEFTTEQILVDDQTAAIRYWFSFRDGAITGSAIVLITFECGEVTDIQQESTELGRQVGLAEAAAEATPAP